MGEAIDVMAFYTSTSSDSITDDAIEACELVGFEVDEDGERVETFMGSEYTKFDIGINSFTSNLKFNLDSSRPPDEPVLSIGCGDLINPAKAADEREYRDRMDATFELLCQLAVTLDVEYAPLFSPPDRHAVPKDRPIAEHVEELPRMGVYSQEVIEDFGSLDAMFEAPPWYTATLEDGKTVVVETEEPWLDGGWQPPTDAEYLDDATFADPDERAQVGRRGFEDPFTSHDTGEIGTDLCVPREKIGPVFRNEDLELVRVRVDENRDLRRVDTGAFVRNIVDEDPGDDIAFMMAMLEDVPPDATADDVMVSALLHEAIPPAFVRLDDADGETVVSKVMALDVETGKHDLLVSLGRVAQQDEFTDDDLETMLGALDTLADLEDVDGIDEYVEEMLL